MRPACWCGRWRQDHVKVIGNSCGKRCPGYKTCESPGPKCERFCRKVCHPGPCEPVVCVKTCILEGFPHFKTGKKAVMHEYRAPRPPPQAHMARSETVAAERSRYSAELTAEREARGEPEPEPPDGVPQLQKGEISVMIFLFLILAGVETGLAFWVKFHIARWTQPLKYKHFVENGRDGEHVAGIVFGCIFCGVFNGVVACLASFTLRRALCHYFRIPRGSGRRFLMLIFVVLFIAACVLPFPIG
jgi:hypothetical protein